MTTPRCCPFCDSRDIRLLTGTGADLVGYRCHDCQNTFYVAELDFKPRTAPTPPPPKSRQKN
jgi:transposase-like protein